MPSSVSRGRAPGREGRSAELTFDEEVNVVGELVHAPDPEAAGDYRAPGQALVFRAPPGAPMRISTEPLAARYSKEASWRVLGSGLGILHSSSCIVLSLPYLTRLTLGHSVQAEVTKKHTETKKSKSSTYLEHYLTARAATGEVFASQVDVADYERVEVGTLLPARVGPLLGGGERGPDASINLGIPLTWFITLALLLGITFMVWREKDTIDHGGDGPIPPEENAASI